MLESRLEEGQGKDKERLWYTCRLIQLRQAGLGEEDMSCWAGSGKKQPEDRVSSSWRYRSESHQHPDGSETISIDKMTWRDCENTGVSVLGTKPWRTSTFKLNRGRWRCVWHLTWMQGDQKKPAGAWRKTLGTEESVILFQGDKAGDSTGQHCPWALSPRSVFLWWTLEQVIVAVTPSGSLAPSSASRKTSHVWTSLLEPTHSPPIPYHFSFVTS